MMNRNAFLRSALGLGAALLGFGACGDDGGEPGVDAATGADATPRSCTMNGTAVTIGSNHGHIMMVSKADITAGTAQSYDIEGGADHPHTVTLSTADYAKLANNEDVMVRSSTGDGHVHTITVRCA